MALFDNRHWLLSHIRNSFISSDDTGMCEAVIIYDIPKDSALFSDTDKFPHAEDSSEDEEELSSSFDIQTDYDFGAHRHRTNTAQRLEKMALERRKAANIKHVKWEANTAAITDEERESLFKRKEIRKTGKVVKSLLADEIDKCPDLPKNPFNEYAKFDGNAQVGVMTRNYAVFLPMLPASLRDYPFHVCVVGSATVLELIGFVCWKYLTEHPDVGVSFHEDVEVYGLYIAEENGEVDWDFSYLEPKETVGKFGLAYLALVEKKSKKVVPEAETTELFKRPESDRKLDVHNEDVRRIEGELTAMEALLYQSFHVFILHKMRARTEVNLGISGDKVEIDPVVQAHSKVGGKLWRHKAISHDIDSVVACDLLEAKSQSRVVFRIVYHSAGTASSSFDQASVPQSASFKSHELEAEQSIAEEIVKKVNHILELKCGAHRREYLAMKQKKPGRRRSFSIWPR